jgi:glyoxylase-like metal-dependent hydrolase (beta-lactamase superfamily II)
MAIVFRENEVFEVGPKVWIRNMVDNAAWADLGDGVAVIDSLEDTATMERQIPADVQATTGKPLKWLVNTHWHPDHTANNAAWARLGATVIAHESCGRAQPEHNGQPNITFSSTYTLQGSERRLELEWLGGTHTPWDSVVYFPWARVLHIADLFGWGMIPLSRYEPDKVELLKRRLARVLEYDAHTYIVGHGPLVKPEHVRRWLPYLEEIQERVPPLARAGRSEAEIAAAVPVPRDMQDWWKLPDWKHAHNLRILAAYHAA